MLKSILSHFIGITKSLCTIYASNISFIFKIITEKSVKLIKKVCKRTRKKNIIFCLSKIIETFTHETKTKSRNSFQIRRITE